MSLRHINNLNIKMIILRPQRVKKMIMWIRHF